MSIEETLYAAVTAVEKARDLERQKKRDPRNRRVFPPWAELSEDDRSGIRAAAAFLEENPAATALDLHDAWRIARFAAGWRYGPVRMVAEAGAEIVGIAGGDHAALEAAQSDQAGWLDAEVKAAKDRRASAQSEARSRYVVARTDAVTKRDYVFDDALDDFVVKPVAWDADALAKADSDLANSMQQAAADEAADIAFAHRVTLPPPGPMTRLHPHLVPWRFLPREQQEKHEAIIEAWQKLSA